jgi:hypothetical protein
VAGLTEVKESVWWAEALYGQHVRFTGRFGLVKIPFGADGVRLRTAGSSVNASRAFLA